MDIRGSRVLLTGATGGIGQAVARALKTHGAQLVLTGRRIDLLEALAAELDADSIAADLARPDDMTSALAKAGDVDILVANAGIPADGRLADVVVPDIDHALAVNLRAPMVLAHRLLPRMMKHRRGHLLFIGSIGALVTAADTTLYNATKFGLRGFVLALRQDLHDSGVGVSIVEPGFIRDAGMLANSGAILPRGFRTSSPEEVAAAVIRAIERNSAETIVAPYETRLAVAAGSAAPELNARLLRLLGISLQT